MTVTVLSAPTEDRSDPVRWVAGVLERRMRALGAIVVHRSELDCTDESLKSVDLGDGVALVGHGHPEHGVTDGVGGCLFGDEALLARVRGRWLTAWACHAGKTLVPRAHAAGASLTAGWRASYSAVWRADDLPQDLSPLLEELVTAVPMAVARGVRDAEALRSVHVAAAERVGAWIDDNEEAVEDGLSRFIDGLTPWAAIVVLLGTAASLRSEGAGDALDGLPPGRPQAGG